MIVGSLCGSHERRSNVNIAMTTEDTQALLRRRLLEADDLAAAGRWAESVQILEGVLSRFPFLADTWYNLGWRLRRLGRPQEALDAYRQALERGASGPEEIHLNRGVILAEDLHKPAEAEREYQTALQLAPSYVPALLNLANLCEDEGRRDEARALYERILIIDPAHDEALARLANCSRIEHPQDPLIARLRRALSAPGLPAAARASLGFALGRALDAAGEFDSAWAAYAAANASSVASAPSALARYDRAAQEALVDRIIDECDESFLSRLADREDHASSAAGPDLVMICGMFRSGSTLAERLLAAHPRVTAGGELDWLPAIIRGDLAPFPESLGTLDAARAAALSARYRARRVAAFPHANILTDKRPDNFLYLGVARALFPALRFVHTRRNPLDNCLSVWFLHLDHGMSYATNLLDIGHYYLQQERLMAHWRRLFGAALHSIDYDSLVREPQPELQRLLAHCGLEWNDRCLDPRNSAGRVGTASVWQVREPLYRGASGRWRNYARHLAPLRAMLTEAGVHLDD